MIASLTDNYIKDCWYQALYQRQQRIPIIINICIRDFDDQLIWTINIDLNWYQHQLMSSLALADVNIDIRDSNVQDTSWCQHWHQRHQCPGHHNIDNRDTSWCQHWLTSETAISRTPVIVNIETRDSNVQDTSARPCCVWCPPTHSQCPVTGPWLQVISCWRSVIRDTRVQTRDNIHVSSHVTWTQYKVRVIEDSRVRGSLDNIRVNTCQLLNKT